MRYREWIPGKVRYEGKDAFSRDGNKVFPVPPLGAALQYVDAHQPPQETIRCRMDHAHGLHNSHEKGKVAQYYERSWMIRDWQRLVELGNLGY